MVRACRQHLAGLLTFWAVFAGKILLFSALGNQTTFCTNTAQTKSLESALAKVYQDAGDRSLLILQYGSRHGYTKLRANLVQPLDSLAIDRFPLTRCVQNRL